LWCDPLGGFGKAKGSYWVSPSRNSTGLQVLLSEGGAHPSAFMDRCFRQEKADTKLVRVIFCSYLPRGFVVVRTAFGLTDIRVGLASFFERIFVSISTIFFKMAGQKLLSIEVALMGARDLFG